MCYGGMYANSCAKHFYGAILTGKTWSADKDHLGQNDCQLTLHTLMHFVEASNLVLSPIIVFNNSGRTLDSALSIWPCFRTRVKLIHLLGCW